MQYPVFFLPGKKQYDHPGHQYTRPDPQSEIGKIEVFREGGKDVLYGFSRGLNDHCEPDFADMIFVTSAAAVV